MSVAGNIETHSPDRQPNGETRNERGKRCVYIHAEGG